MMSKGSCCTHSACICFHWGEASGICDEQSALLMTGCCIVTFVGFVSFDKEYSSFGLWREACGSQVLLRWLADKQFKVSFWEVCI